MLIKIHDERLALRLQALADQAHTPVSKWVTEALAEWLAEHRSGRYLGDPKRHDARGDDHTEDYLV